MQPSNFSRKVEHCRKSSAGPPPGKTDVPQLPEPLESALRHLEAGLRRLHSPRGHIVRQQEDLDNIRAQVGADFKRLQAEVIAISDMERGRIARDLHDALGQNLTGIAFIGKMLERTLQEHGLPEAANAREIWELAARAMRQTRALAHGLFPLELRANEFIPRMKALATDTQHTFHMACRFEYPAEPRPIRDDEIATHLYHIAQEAMTNAFKHGRARNAHIRLQIRKDASVLTIQDDGAGFRPSDKASGIGLRIMSYRASLLGGTLSVESSPGQGTTVTCNVPTRQPG